MVGVGKKTWFRIPISEEELEWKSLSESRHQNVMEKLKMLQDPQRQQAAEMLQVPKQWQQAM